MPSRSVKSCFRARVKRGFALALALAPLSAEATVRVTPVNEDGNALSISHNSILYYPVSGGALSAGVFLDASDTTVPNSLYDITKTQAELTSTRANMFLFNVGSDKAITGLTGSQRLVVTVTANGTASGGYKLVPIAFVQYPTLTAGGGASCVGSGNCQGDSGLDDSNGDPYVLGVAYTAQTTIQVGIYPADICSVYSSRYGGRAYGCTGSAVNPTGSTEAMQLTFSVVTASDSTSVPPDTGAHDTGISSLAFETDGTALTSCPSATNLYFPGDGQIYFQTTGFSTTVTTGRAPLNRVIVVGNDGAAATLSSTYSTDNAVSAVLSINSTDQVVSGFTNTTDGTDHAYQIGYMVRDVAGFVGSSASCALTDVRTSEVQGFLQKSRCFIATAAYRSNDAWPVLLLREFRDRVLMSAPAGRHFVSWYYDWSPAAAEWLMEHPVFRFPVLVALIPVQAVAWLFLHPLWAFFLSVAAASAWALSRRGDRNERAAA